MKKIISAVVLIMGLCTYPRVSFSQQPPAAYTVPDSYNFDYEVVQDVKGKSAHDAKSLNYYFTQNSDYVALQPADDKSKLIIFAKGGYTIVVDNDKKTIMVINLGNMIGEVGKAMGDPQKKYGAGGADSIGKTGSSVKTGNTKQICGYTADEYKFTSSKGEVSTVWCAKVDFNASLFPMMLGGGGMGGMSGGKGMGRPMQSQSYPSFTDPHLFLAEASSASRPDDGLTTKSITKKSMSVSTKNYTVNNLSGMGIKEMMEMKGKQN